MFNGKERSIPPVEKSSISRFGRTVFDWVASKAGRPKPQYSTEVDLSNTETIESSGESFIFRSADFIIILAKEKLWRGALTGDFDPKNQDLMDIDYTHQHPMDQSLSKTTRIKVRFSDVMQTLTDIPEFYDVVPDQVIGTLNSIYDGIKKAGKATEYRALGRIATLIHTSIGFTFLKEHRERSSEIAYYAADDKDYIMSLEKEEIYNLSDTEEDEVWGINGNVKLNRLGLVVDAKSLLSSILRADIVDPWDIDELKGNEEINAFYLHSTLGIDEKDVRIVFQMTTKDADFILLQALIALKLPDNIKTYLVSSYLEVVNGFPEEQQIENHLSDFAPKFYHYLIRESREDKDN